MKERRERGKSKRVTSLTGRGKQGGKSKRKREDNSVCDVIMKLGRMKSGREREGGERERGTERGTERGREKKTEGEEREKQ